MKTRTASLLVAALVIGGSVVTGGVAHAEAPPNDDIENATVIGASPWTDVVDTTDATTSTYEASLATYCFAPKMEHGVWYSSDVAQDGYATIDVSASKYSVSILVIVDDVVSGCGGPTLTGPVTAGQHLDFLIFGDGYSEPTYGVLKVEVRNAVPPPEIAVTLDPVAYVDQWGTATITGTVTCTSVDGVGMVLGVDGQARQRVGRGYVTGWFYSEFEIPCDGTTVAWTAFATPDGGKFAGGKAATVAFSFGCGTELCGGGFVEATIQMRKGPRA